MRPLGWVGGGAAALVLLGGLSAIIAPTVAQQRVPERWRAGRWETSDEGLRARRLTERACGPFVGDAWLDFPETAERPVAREATPDFSLCFDQEVAPVFARNRID